MKPTAPMLRWKVSEAGIAKARETFVGFIALRKRTLAILKAAGRTADLSELTDRQREAILDPSDNRALSQEVRWRALSDLRPNAGDTPPTEEGIAFYVAQFEVREPVPPIPVYADGELWDGHNRLAAASRLGFLMAPTLEVPSMEVPEQPRA